MFSKVGIAAASSGLTFISILVSIWSGFVEREVRLLLPPDLSARNPERRTYWALTNVEFEQLAVEVQHDLTRGTYHNLLTPGTHWNNTVAGARLEEKDGTPVDATFILDRLGAFTSQAGPFYGVHIVPEPVCLKYAMAINKIYPEHKLPDVVKSRPGGEPNDRPTDPRKRRQFVRHGFIYEVVGPGQLDQWGRDWKAEQRAYLDRWPGGETGVPTEMIPPR